MDQESVLNRISTVDALTHIFSEEITNGKWEPGDQCKDTVMVARYGVSRNSVREAFSILVEQGLLKKKANKGFFVPVFSESDIRELYEARLIIELQAIEKLAEKRLVTAEMYAAVDILKATTIEDLRSCVMEADWRFHTEMTRNLNNGRVLNMLERLLTEIQIINRQPHPFFPIDFIISEHEKVIKAILAGDVSAARQVMNEHLIVSIERQIAEMEGKEAQ